jgi:steroid delta-isomerase-like uncharacterized protein
MAYDVGQWIRSWSPGSGPTKGETVGALYTDDAERWDVAIDSRLTGRDAMVAFAAGFLDAMPDAVCELRNSAQDGDTVLIEWTWRGTHTGDSEAWPARGESVVLVGCNVLRLGADGLIRSETSYWDKTALFGA